jgi:hypothetical protein
VINQLKYMASKGLSNSMIEAPEARTIPALIFLLTVVLTTRRFTGPRGMVTRIPATRPRKRCRI